MLQPKRERQLLTLDTDTSKLLPQQDQNANYGEVSALFSNLLNMKLQEENYKYQKGVREMAEQDRIKEQQRNDYAYGQLAETWVGREDALNTFKNMGFPADIANQQLQNQYMNETFMPFVQQIRSEGRDISMDDLMTHANYLPSEVYNSFAGGIAKKDFQERFTALSEWTSRYGGMDYHRFVEAANQIGVDPANSDIMRIWTEHQQRMNYYKTGAGSGTGAGAAAEKQPSSTFSEQELVDRAYNSVGLTSSFDLSDPSLDPKVVSGYVKAVDKVASEWNRFTISMQSKVPTLYPGGTQVSRIGRSPSGESLFFVSKADPKYGYRVDSNGTVGLAELRDNKWNMLNKKELKSVPEPVKNFLKSAEAEVSPKKDKGDNTWLYFLGNEYYEKRSVVRAELSKINKNYKDSNWNPDASFGGVK